MTMATVAKTSGKWTLDDVERLGKFMRAEGISLVALPGLKMMRHPQEAYYGAVGKETEKIGATKQPTDEQLLFNPMHGLMGESDG